MKKLVIFDLDGTLLNTYADIAAATNHALRLRGYPEHSVAVIKSFVGNGINKLFERALPEGHKHEFLEIRRDFIPFYNEHGTELTFVFDGMTELLEKIQSKNIKIGVASNKYEEATKHLMKHFFPTIGFTAVIGQREGIPTKPDPGIVYEIMKAAEVEDPTDVLYIGDSEVDMQTAKNAGVDVIGVSWGCKTREQLESHFPLSVVDKADEINGFIS